MKQNIYCIRAESGEWTDHFLKGSYAAIGWLYDHDLSNIKSDDELVRIANSSQAVAVVSHFSVGWAWGA